MLRAAIKQVVSASARHLMRVEASHLRHRGLNWTLQWNRMLLDAYIRERRNRRYYLELTEEQLRGRRRSDIVFVFGSGYSLNDISDAEWRHFAEHDTFGFNMFIYEQWVPIHFHLFRGGAEGALQWRPYAEHIADVVLRNANCRNTAFLMQGEFQAQFCNQMVGYRLLPEGSAIFRYGTARSDGPPTASFAEGLRHIGGTLSDAVNAAACLGWTAIILVGIDLYDSRYFWLPPMETPNINYETGALSAEFNAVRGTRYDDAHNTVRIGIVNTMAEWRRDLAGRGCELMVYNPRSLLAAVMPVYDAMRG